MIPSTLAFARAFAVSLALLVPAAALAQPSPDDAGADPTNEIDVAVAKALFERGKVLFARGDYANAKQMFIESIERDAKGLTADSALAMLRSSNEKLGIKDLDHGSPFSETAPGTGNDLVDPYGDGTKDDGPQDPYADNKKNINEPVDPYGEDAGKIGVPPQVDEPVGGGPVPRSRVMLWGGLHGALLGGFIGDTVTGTNTTTSGEAFASMLIGGAIGIGGGYVYANKRKPTEGQLAQVNSFGIYGMTAGLMLGVAIDPPETEAYSVNAAVGIAGGLTIGHFMSTKYDISQRRMLRIDLGALAGFAATWALFYPLVSDDGSNNDEQASGLVSIAAAGAGALIARYLTRDMDKKRAVFLDGSVGTAPPPPPGLIQRDAHGRWGVGLPLPRPMENPVLAPRTGAKAFGLDVLGGRF